MKCLLVVCCYYPLSQLLIIQFLWTGKVPFIQSWASTRVLIVSFGIASIILAIPYIPKVNTALHMMPPEPEFYGYLVAILVGYAIVIQFVKIFYQMIFKEWL